MKRFLLIWIIVGVATLVTVWGFMSRLSTVRRPQIFTNPQSNLPQTPIPPREEVTIYTDAQLLKMINDCQVIGYYSYHNGEKGFHLQNTLELKGMSSEEIKNLVPKTLALQGKTMDEIKRLVEMIPEKCGDLRIHGLE